MQSLNSEFVCEAMRPRRLTRSGFSSPSRHVHPAGPPLFAESARASLSARTGCVASRGIGGVKRRPIAWVSTGVGKTSGGALSSRANAFRLISSRHSDMLVRRFPTAVIAAAA